MLKTITVLLIALFLPACVRDTPAPGADADTAGAPAVTDSVPLPSPSQIAPDSLQVTANGWGPLRIGMTRAEVVAAAGEDANPNAVGGPEPDACEEFRPARSPAGMLVMLERDTLTRISVSRNTDVMTPEGFHVGDSAAVVLRRYGQRAEVMPHKYEAAPARYITIWENTPGITSRRGIVYEVDGTDRIRAIRVGGPSIQYVEGCL